MRTRCTRWLAAATCAAVLGSTAAAASAGASAPRPAPSDKYCEAVQTNYAVTILIGFISAFADIGNDASGDSGGETADPDEIRGTFLLVLSPALESTSRELAKGGSKRLRKIFAAQGKVFARGVEILKDDVGLTDEQIDALSNIELSTDPNSASELETVFEDNDIDEDEVKALGKDFAQQLKDTGLADIGPKQRQEFERLGTRCGVTASTEFACEDLINPEDATAILGVEATVDDDEPCAYLGPDPETGLQSELAVEVYESARAYERFTESATESDTFDGVGDKAISFEGFSVGGSIKTCGRTLVAVAGERTIVVALCLPDDAPVSDDVLTQIGTQVVDKLG